MQIVQMHTTKHCNLQLAYSEDPQAAPYKPPVYSILPYFGFGSPIVIDRNVPDRHACATFSP